MQKAPTALVVGQGLAGSVFARFWEMHGGNVVLFNSPNAESASRAAAGVWNPIVIKRFVKTWMADQALAVAIPFYQQEEQRLNTPFFHFKPLHKVLSNEQEKEEFFKRFETEHLEHLMDAGLHSDWPEMVNAPYGTACVRQAGYMQVAAYLDAAKAYWQNSQKLHSEHFDYELLMEVEGIWHYKQYQAEVVVFAEGTGANKNPWLSHLPFRNTKGQVLKVELPDLTISDALNKQVFVMPQPQKGVFRVGSTYEWQFDHTQPTEKGKQELLEKLNKMIQAEPRVIEQVAGVRPTMNDRRPLLGAVPKLNSAYVFNGLGSRGVLQAPWLAQALVEHILLQKPLPAEADIKRYP